MMAFEGISESQLPAGRSVYRGKVRDVIDAGSHLVFVTTDRISAFDRNLGFIAGKGEILNQLSLYWFRQTKDVIENHVMKEISPRATMVKKAKVIPIEVIVRGYLTGSAWKEYQAGRMIPGLVAPAGMKAHQKLPNPVITPTTKEAVGDHDRPIGREEIVRSVVSEELWSQVEKAALSLYRRGQELLAKRGLILVDTKYEFGLVDDKLILVDEIHTPDCSRFWFLEDYDKSFAAGKEPRKLDKEFFRSWLSSQGFDGNGPAPAIPESVFQETLARYIETYELITGQKWVSKNLSPHAEIQILQSVLK